MTKRRRVRIKTIGFCDGVNRLKQKLTDLGVKNKAELKLNGQVDKPLQVAWNEIRDGSPDRQKAVMDELRAICKGLGWSVVDEGLTANRIPPDAGVGEWFVFDELSPNALKEADADKGEKGDGHKPGTWASDARVDKAPAIS